jgi:hypothetical protein
MLNTKVMGLIAHLTGYLLLWATYERRIEIEPSPIILGAFYFLAGYGSVCFYMSSVGVNVINFKSKYMGIVTAFLLLFYGLSGSIFSQIFAYQYADMGDGESDVGGYLLFLAISGTVINFICTLFMSAVPKKMEYQLLEESKNKSKTNDIASIPVPIKSALEHPHDDMEMALVDKNSPETMYSKEEAVSSSQESPPPVNRAESEDLSLTPTQILMTGTFWLYAITYTLQQGFSYVTNVAFIIRANEGPVADPVWVAKTAADHITLYSVANSGARFLFAVLSDIIGDKLGLDRSFLLIIGELIMLIPQLALAIGTDAIDIGTNLLWMCSLFVGVGWGAGGALFPSLTRDFFGTKYYGTASGFIMSAVPVGIVFSNQIFGAFYDMEALEQDSKDGLCYGKACYQSAFVVSTVLQLIAFILSIVLFRMRMKIIR